MDLKKLGTKIKTFRKLNKLTQQELADKLEISRSALSYYELGKIEPNIYTLIKLSNIMKCSIDYLVDNQSSNTDTDIITDTNAEPFEEIQLYNKKMLSILHKLSKINVNLLNSFLAEFNTNSNNIDDKKTNLKEEYSTEICSNIIEFKAKEKDIDYTTIDWVGKVSAGNPCYAYEEILGEIDIPSKYLCSSKNYFILEINGDSMNELFNNGELILVEKNSFVQNNDIIIAFIHDEEGALCKKVEFHSNEISLIPLSTNPIHKIKTYSSSEVYVLGKVLGKVSDFIPKNE